MRNIKKKTNGSFSISHLRKVMFINNFTSFPFVINGVTKNKAAILGTEGTLDNEMVFFVDR